MTRSAPVTGPDPLARCVMHLSAHLGHPVSEAALLEALPAEEAPAQSADASLAQGLRRAIIAAERAGLSAFFGRRAAARIGAELLPAILPMRDGGAVVLHERRGEDVVIHDPLQGDGLWTKPAADLFSGWTGHLLSLRVDPARAARAHDGTGGAEGHWFRGALAANRWAYVQVGIAAVVTNVLALVASLFTMVVYDRILPSAATDSLLALTVGVGLALVFDLVVKTIRATFIDQAGQRADQRMGQQIFDHVIGIQQGARRGSVGAVSATLREFETLRDFFTSATLVALVDLPFVLIFLAAIFFLGGPLVIVPAVAVPLVLLVGVAVQPVLGRLADRMLSEGQLKQAVLVETLTGIETIKATGAGARMRARWAEALARQSDYATRSRGVTQLAINLTGFLQQAAQILIVVYGALLVVEGEITSGVLIASVILTGRALAPLAVIAQTLTRLHQARTSYRSLDGLMQAPVERPAGRQWLARPILAGGVAFENVDFAYPGQRGRALEGVSFTIRPGERVAFLGSVGSGKSTVARLVLGLHAPGSGAVTADGVDLRQIDPADLRRNIGTVLQDTWLVSGTLRENIALGSHQPTDAAILRAAQLAGVEDFAARHPDGYAMRLSERGEGLSGGQRQAVALARALLDEPSILLLDEPTAAMDTTSEAALIARLKPLLEGRTLLLVTHRPSLLELVDRVIVLNDGKVVADGPKSILQRRPVAAPGSAA
ncbi:ATP-binding cassette, subfamily C, LapB [Salipiger marinus]|uniref:ATP-binding cassette, subfamily C, LapB n=2 Tax=Salipiger marinus TaxID=555512 RepID=A0A1G8V0H7_9RHOB|nr:ATP-binding cassette, subfamily C, LapB [Salipiger marinus]